MSLQDRRIQYETAGLERSELQDDPFVQWNAWYEQAASAGVAEPNAMSVATIADDGIPDARIVLVRKVDASGLVFYTNYTSDKSAQLKAQPVASAVFSWLEVSSISWFSDYQARRADIRFKRTGQRAPR